MKRGVRFVLVFIGLAVLVSMAGIVLMYLAVSRGPTVPSTAMLVLRPGGEIQEVVPDDVFGLLGRNTQTVRGFIESLEKAKREPRARYTSIAQYGAYALVASRDYGVLVIRIALARPTSSQSPPTIDCSFSRVTLLPLTSSHVCSASAGG